MPLSDWARILTLAYIGFNGFYSWRFQAASAVCKTDNRWRVGGSPISWKPVILCLIIQLVSSLRSIFSFQAA